MRRRLFTRPVRDAVGAELDFHVAMRARELTRAGMPAPDAEARARAEFATREAIAAECVAIAEATEQRRGRRERVADSVRDIRFAVRQLLKAPAFSLGVIATLALGIGAGSSVFALLDGIFWRWPAGVSAPAALQRVWITSRPSASNPPYSSTDIDYPRYRAVGALLPASASALYSVDPSATVHVRDASLPAHLAFATASLFPLAGAHALLGRLYGPGEDVMGAAAPVAVISESFWRRSLGADAGVIGTSLAVGRIRYQIIGVVAAPFTGVDLEAVDAWVPLGGYPGVGQGAAPWWASRNWSGFQMLFRAPPGAANAAWAARATLAMHAADAQAGSVDSSARVTAGSLILARGPGERSAEMSIAVQLGGVALLLLLIVTANVLGLMLARAAQRRQEIALRLALGISRGRLLRLLLAESAVLAAVAAVASVLVASAGGALLRRWLFPDTRWAAPPLHWHLVAFAAVAALAIALVTSLISMRVATGNHATLIDRVHGRSVRGAGRLRQGAVIGQIALSTVLLVGAVLFAASLRNVRRLDVGYDADRLVYAAVRAAPGESSGATAARLDEVVARIAVHAAAEGTSRTSAIPLQLGGFGIPWFAGTDSMGARSHFRPTVSRVASGYFAVVGLRFVTGGDFGTRTSGVVVNQKMAETVWPGVNPVGQCLRLGTREAACHLVTGVVRDAHRSALIESPLPQYFIAANDSTVPMVPAADIVVLRVAAARSAAASALLGAALQRAFPDARVWKVRLQETLERAYHPWQLGAALFALFGVLALLVASVGVYGVVAYDVAQRLHDFGIRSALGAGAGRLASGVIRSALGPVAVGAAVGVLLSLAAARSIRALLYGVSPHAAAALVAGAMVPLLAAVVASLRPAWRAAHADPAIGLRNE